jgi:hypothetical protein
MYNQVSIMLWHIEYINNAGKLPLFTLLQHLIICRSGSNLGSGVKDGISKMVDLDGMEDAT